MKVNSALQAIQSLKTYNELQDRMHLRRKYDELVLEKKLTAQRLEEIELKRIRLNRELNQNGQNVDTYA
jgi:predicted nuclease with TOPRIM domain